MRRLNARTHTHSLDEENEGFMMLPWHHVIILCASLFTLDPLFITLNIAFATPHCRPAQVLLYHFSNSTHILMAKQQQQQQPSLRPAHLKVDRRQRMDGRERGRDSGGETTSRLHVCAKITAAEGRGEKSCG